MSKRPLFLAAIVFGLCMMAAPKANAQVALVPGDRIKLECPPNAAPDHVCRGVYYYSTNGKRFTFPNSKAYLTWYSDYVGVKTITLEQMYTIALGGNVTYRPGVKMIKIDTDPKVYAVTRSGILRWIKTELAATSLYGVDWNKKIDDIPDWAFINYRVGKPIETVADFNLALMRDASPNVDSDKLLADPTGLVVDVRTSGFSPQAKNVAQNNVLTWVNVSNGLAQVASDPHPTHTGLPGFESPSMELGQEYSFQFLLTGSWGYHNHLTPSQTGTVVVQ